MSFVNDGDAMRNSRVSFWVLTAALLPLLCACVSATHSVRAKEANIGSYREVYLVPPDNDPRRVVPKVVAEFEKLGMKVTLGDARKTTGSQGTGFIITADGYAVTCAHILDEQPYATVWLGEQRIEADVVARHVNKDLALLKLRAPPGTTFRPLSIKQDDAYQLGAEIHTIGFPLSEVLGKSARYTKGFINATAGLKDEPSYLQISAEIQPGNSGGPVFDKNGVVIGVVSSTLNPAAVYENTGGQALPQNVNFAIKAGVVREYLTEVRPDLSAAPTGATGASVDEAQQSIVRVRSGNVTEVATTHPKLVAGLSYVSVWDMWYRFRYFAIQFYDYDSRKPLFIAGQTRDNLVSTEEVVIRDTFVEIRRILGIKP